MAEIKEPLDDFFSNYPPFVYNASASATSEFNRLCLAEEWTKKSAHRREATKAFNTALIRQFNVSYGTNASSLQDWHKVLARMGVTPLPHTITECKQIIDRSHVNLVDLVAVAVGGDAAKTVKMFESEEALSKYTRRTRKIFPKQGAKAGGILAFLLRHIFQPGEGTGKAGRRRRRKKKQQ